MEMSLFFLPYFKTCSRRREMGMSSKKKREDKRFTVLLVVVTCHF